MINYSITPKYSTVTDKQKLNFKYYFYLVNKVMSNLLILQLHMSNS